MSLKRHYYNIVGYIIAVEGPANNIFLKEYGWAKIENNPTKADLYVKVSACKDLPTKPPGSLKGMHIPFGEDEDILWYEEGAPLNVLLSYCEGLMWWPDKCLLHAGAVARNGKAFIFTGGGNVGKTSMVLSLLREGFDYLSDDWLVIGRVNAYPLPKPLHIFDYNLRNRDIAKSVLGLKRVYYKPYFQLIKFARKYSPHRYLRFAFEFLKPMFEVELRKLHPKVKVASPTQVTKVFYLERKETSHIEVKKDIGAQELARRMAYVNLYEWNFFFREYYRYAYLYGLKNTKIENRFNHDFSVMYELFKEVELFRVTIPMQLDLTKVDFSSRLELE
jgi:hypothetical protein